MGYLHIDNLYKDARMFQFDECWALEKIHGTSAHIRWSRTSAESVDPRVGELTFFSGGEKYDNFVALFDAEDLRIKFESLGQDEVIVYGEAYGGKQQGMRETYGDALKFVAFDVKMAGNWLDVQNADTLVTRFLKLEFVDYKRINATLEAMDAERDRPSTQAARNGITEPKKREGVVLRPIGEVFDDRGNRIITKHKNAEFMETKTPRVVDMDKLKVLAEAHKIAEEWVTPMRLQHVLDKAQVLKNDAGDTTPMTVEDTGQIIGIMLEDIKREAKGEIVESPGAMKAIGSATAKLFKKQLNDKFQEAHYAGKVQSETNQTEVESHQS